MSDVQRVAVRDVFEGARWLVLPLAIPIRVEAKQSGCADRLRTAGFAPTVVPEYAFIEVGDPDSSLLCCLYVGYSVAEEKLTFQRPVGTKDATVSVVRSVWAPFTARTDDQQFVVGERLKDWEGRVQAPQIDPLNPATDVV